MKAFCIPLRFKHKYSLLTPSKVHVPRDIQIPVFLIRHELESRMLFNALSTIGLHDCYFEAHLDRLILASLRMWDGTDETFKIYFDLMCKWSKDVNTNDDVITRRALKIYYALIKARDKRGLELNRRQKHKKLRVISPKKNKRSR